MKRLLCSRWTKRIINLIIIVNIVIWYYIFLFVGYGTTSIDDICLITGIVFMIVQIARSIIRGMILENIQSQIKS